jgi:hypothetical protein
MVNLFLKIKTKEDDAREKIERRHEEFNLKAALAGYKKLMEQFTKTFSEVDVDISELMISKVSAATGKATKEEISCLKEMKELHAVIESTLKEDITKFNSMFDGDLSKKVIKEKKKADNKVKAQIFGSIVKSNHIVLLKPG